MNVNPRGRAVKGVCVRPLACWRRGFDSRQGNGCLSLVGIVCCYVQSSALGRSIVRRSPTDCGISKCQSVRHCTIRICRAKGEKKMNFLII